MIRKMSGIKLCVKLMPRCTRQLRRNRITNIDIVFKAVYLLLMIYEINFM